MKLLPFLTGLVLISLSTACSTNKSSVRSENDDRYYSLADANHERRSLKKLTASQPEQSINQNQSQSQSNTDGYSDTQNSDYRQIPDNSSYSTPSGNGGVTNNYYNQSYDMDNYYDYMYASRIRRFNNPSRGIGYYDPFYTNAYWYNGVPSMFGTSIYSTYGFFNPYSPWGGGGFNMGWNSYSGFSMGFGYGYNPYSYYNPWRPYGFGYNPYMSPYGYNPFGYSPYGYGAMGYGGMGYGGMGYSPVYYNSYDANSYVSPSTSTGTGQTYGPNTNGSGVGSGFAGKSLNQLFSQEIGLANSENDYKLEGGKSANPNSNSTTSPGKASGTNIQTQNPATSISDSKSQQYSGNKVNTEGNKATDINPVKAGKESNYTSVQSQNAATDSKSPSPSQVQAGAQPTKVQSSSQLQTPSKVQSNGEVKSQVQGNQTGKEGLISNGVIRSTDSKAVQSNYNSSPASIKSERPTDNTPEAPFNRQPVNEQNNYNRATLGTQQVDRPQPVRSQNQLSAPNRQAETVSPSNRVNTNPAVPSGSQPANRQQQNNYQQYQNPSRYQNTPNPEPRNNYQQSAPRQEQRNNNYQAPSQRQQSAPAQRYEQPAQPRQSQPRQYEQRMQSPQRMSSPSQERGNFNSSPRMNSGGNSGSMRSSGGGSGGGRVNSPRR